MIDKIKKHKTPWKDDAFVIEISLALVGQKAVYVPLKAESFAQEGQCANNVVEKVKRDGGGIACGWQITVIPKFYWSAIFHVVWRANNGTLIDVTPPQVSI